MKTKEEQREYSRNYRFTYPDRVRETNRKHREKYRDKVLDRTREWQRKNPDKMRESNWIAQGIDITFVRYQEMLVQQNFRCAICNTHESELGKALCVDHCHKTGKVRGLLCQACNDGLGRFGESKEILEVAVKYLSV